MCQKIMDRWKFFTERLQKKKKSFQIVSENLRDLNENEDSVQGLG